MVMRIHGHSYFQKNEYYLTEKNFSIIGKLDNVS